MATDAVIDIRDASKSFGQHRALDGVSLRLSAGEMVALIGPSGSGKSTLLRAISGFVALDAGPGHVEAFGRKVQENGRIADGVREIRSQIGMVFQQFNLVGRLTLFSNVALGMLGRIGVVAGLFGLWPTAEKLAVMAALARVGVADFAGQRAGTLSGGQQQRAAIARALVQKAKVILADEPVASLDPVAARRVMDLLTELNAKDGISILVSLHQVDYAMRYCSRVVALKAGKIAYDGPTSGLSHDKLVDIYGPEIEEVFWEGMPK